MSNIIKAKGMAGSIPVYCAFDKIVPVGDLVPNPKNPNQHPEDQLELLAKIIRVQGWRAPVTVSTLSGMIVRGHGRYLAGKLIGCPVPVDYQDYATEADEMADLVADNRIAELAEMDKKMLAEIMSQFDEESISLTGYSESEIDEITASLSGELAKEVEEANAYSQKIQIPQYEITGETPEIQELYDTTKYYELLRDIESDGTIDEKEREFLKLAASRHIVFNYRNIAEYYAASSPAMQGLMEDSALVIIDAKNAIANGFATLASTINAIMDEEEDNA